MTENQPPQPGADTPAATATPRSLTKPYNRAGAPSIVDLGFDAQPEADGADDSRKDTSKDLIGFPGERAPHISYGFEGERWRIRNVVWVISQSPTGQSLLDHTYRSGYRLGFDTMVSTGERLESSVNLTDRAIHLDTRANNEQLVVALALQLGFASAAIDGVFFDSSHHPPAALLAQRLAAASAHAVQLQICFELRSAPTLPANADKDAYWRLAAKEQPRLSSALAQTAINDMALSQGAAMAAAIREFYAHTALRTRYDVDVISYFMNMPATSLKDPKAMTQDFDPVAQSYKLKFPGVAYATSHDPKLDLTAGENTSASAEIAEAVAALQTTRRNAGVKDRISWQIKTT